MSPHKLDASLPVAPATETRRDSWAALSRFTPARIALGRAGGSQRTEALLRFRLDHAQARDAVLQEFHPQAVEDSLAGAGLDSFRLVTAAPDRQIYLMRPDLGRTLSANSRQALEHERGRWGARDLAIIVSDGLSALAAERHAGPTLARLVPLLREAGWTLFPVFIAPFGRVKLQDEIGERLDARHTLMLLGERPGLGSADSLGAYFTFQPQAGCTDADRNCISNIRAQGLPPARAADRLARLLVQSARLGLSGVRLREAAADVLADPSTFS